MLNNQDNSDLEIEAMQKISQSLSGLNDEAIGRVLRWAADKFGAQLAPSLQAIPGGKVPLESAGGPEEEGLEELADVFSRAAPTSDANKALVAGYWLQCFAGMSDFDTQRVNTELKHLGYGVGNITRAFDTLKSRKPAMVVQLKKSGSTKQARKKLKLTNEGIKVVQGMLGKGDF